MKVARREENLSDADLLQRPPAQGADALSLDAFGRKGAEGLKVSCAYEEVVIDHAVAVLAMTITDHHLVPHVGRPVMQDQTGLLTQLAAQSLKRGLWWLNSPARGRPDPFGPVGNRRMWSREPTEQQPVVVIEDDRPDRHPETKSRHARTLPPPDDGGFARPPALLPSRELPCLPITGRAHRGSGRRYVGRMDDAWHSYLTGIASFAGTLFALVLAARQLRSPIPVGGSSPAVGRAHLVDSIAVTVELGAAAALSLLYTLEQTPLFSWAAGLVAACGIGLCLSSGLAYAVALKRGAFSGRARVEAVVQCIGNLLPLTCYVVAMLYALGLLTFGGPRTWAYATAVSWLTFSGIVQAIWWYARMWERSTSTSTP